MSFFNLKSFVVTACASSTFFRCVIQVWNEVRVNNNDRIFILEGAVSLSTGRENKDLAKMFMQFCHICNLNSFAPNSLGIPMKDRSLVILF